MTTLYAETTFAVIAALEYFEESEDLYLYPENAGLLAVRELRYPGDVLAPFQYESNPDYWENFDSVPMTNRAQVKTEMTISSSQVVQWKGYYPDRSVREIWKGMDTKSRMFAFMMRRFYEYFAYPPPAGFITWHPKDRTEQAYLIQIESIEVGGQDLITFDWVALYQGDMLTADIVFKFRIIDEA
jgi:hypothetical protein